MVWCWGVHEVRETLRIGDAWLGFCPWAELQQTGDDDLVWWYLWHFLCECLREDGQEEG